MSSSVAPEVLRKALPDRMPPGERVLERLLRGFAGSAAFRIGAGSTHVVGKFPPEFTIVIRDPSVLRTLAFKGSLLPVAEAYFRGLVEIEGDLYAALRLKGHFQRIALRLPERLALLRDLLRIPRPKQAPPAANGPAQIAGGRSFRHRHTRPSDREAISFHYDASNRFYGIWLDPEMLYSCAYFEDPSWTIDQAQRAKLDHICRKLRLSAGERFLDVGCGWGGLVCWAAARYGVRAHGITISQNQFEYARERVARSGLQDRVTVERRDYRDLPGNAAYDKVASIGMFEHVGLAHLAVYNATVRRVLRPGGLFLNHGVTRDDEGWKKTTETRFINRYIFPDAEVDTVGNVLQGMERAGFEIHDVESLRMHYALTLRHWVRRLEAGQAQAVAEVGEIRYRTWRLYMAACALQFEEGATSIHQILASNRAGGPAPVPLTRRDLYF